MTTASRWNSNFYPKLMTPHTSGRSNCRMIKSRLFNKKKAARSSMENGKGKRSLVKMLSISQINSNKKSRGVPREKGDDSKRDKSKREK